MKTFDETAWYTIAAKAGGKVIEVENACEENGAAVCLADATGADHQLWAIRNVDGKYHKIVNKQTGKALDVIAMGTVNGANLHQWEFVDSDSQMWFFEDKADGVAIKSALSAKCIDVVGMNAEQAGARLQIWVDVDGENQTWLIQEVEAPKAEEVVPVAEEATKAEEAAPVAEEAPKAEEAAPVAAEAPKTEEVAPAKKTTRKTSTRKTAAKKTTTRKTTARKTTTRKNKAQREAEAKAAAAKAEENK